VSLDFSSLSLERRLLFSYLGAFVGVFAIAAVLAHFLLAAAIERESATHLEDIARAGLRSVLFANGTLRIDETEISNAALLRRDQGLEWFDDRGRLLATQGLNPGVDAGLVDGFRQLSSGQREFDTFSAPIVRPNTQIRVGTVRASQWNDRRVALVAEFDNGLLAGTLLAILGSGMAGLVLTRLAVRPVVKSIETLRAFSADASHELRGPLTAIASTADAALRDARRDPMHDRSRFEAIADGARQMSRLTNDLLLLAGSERSMERELFAIDLVPMLRTLEARYCERFAEAGIALTFTTDRHSILYGNPNQIERILSNLLENALRYTPAAGMVSVESSQRRGIVSITVRDSGIGIAKENLTRIFERFWRADPARSREGSGLGLAIARALARRHGGDVTVTSEVGRGSAFVASFPVRPYRAG
jgi:two-component system, OmpR family, manganese sensing sensor histidine kinase